MAEEKNFFGELNELELAASEGDLEKFKYLLSLPNNNFAEYLNSSLEVAVRDGRLNVVEYIVTLPNVDPAEEGNLLIYLAALNGHLEIVKFLITLPGVNPAAGDNAAVRAAALNGHIEMVNFLLTLDGVDFYPQPGSMYEQALVNAAVAGHLAMVKLLVTLEHINVNAANNLVLYEATEAGQVEVVKFLLTQPKVSFTSNCPAFSTTAGSGHLDMVIFLLTLDVDFSAEFGPAFKDAAKNGHVLVVQHLLSLPNVKFTPEEVTAAFSGALKNGHDKITTCLISTFPSILTEEFIASICKEAFLHAAAYDNLAGIELILTSFATDSQVQKDLFQVTMLLESCSDATKIEIAEIIIEKISMDLEFYEIFKQMCSKNEALKILDELVAQKRAVQSSPYAPFFLLLARDKSFPLNQNLGEFIMNKLIHFDLQATEPSETRRPGC